MLLPLAHLHVPTAGGGGGGSITGLSSEVAVLRASDYSSGQTWANAVASPADGSSQTDHDVWLGATSASEASEPTINGSGSGAYFSFDGGDYFTFKSAPLFWEKLVRTGADGTPFWIAFVWRYDSSTTNRQIGGQQTNNQGIDIYNTASQLTYARRQDSGTFHAASLTGLSLSNGDYIGVIISGASWAASTTQGPTFYLNSTTGTQVNFSATFGAASTSNVGAPKIGANQLASAFTPSASQLFSLAYGNEEIDSAKAATLFSWMETDTGLTLLP